MSGMKAFNIKDLAISLSGVPLDAGGFGDDDVLSIEWDEDQWETFTGADGEVTRSATNNYQATATLRLSQTSDVNDRLSALLHADLALPNGAGAGAFMCKDVHGRAVISSERAWVNGFPKEVKFGKGTKVWEWQIKLANARTSVLGGR
jgi:hypothetical protein